VLVVFVDGEAPLKPLAWVLFAMPVAYLIFGIVRRELRTPGMFQLQLAGLLVFAVITLVVLYMDHDTGRYLLAAGWLGHAAWDVAHHRANRVVPVPGCSGVALPNIRRGWALA
jgi:hypothetical protein